MAETPKQHEAKPDPMADRAPEHVKRTVEEQPSSGIEVGLPRYHENTSGQILDHRLYVEPDPALQYRFITNNEKFGAARSRAKGFRPDMKSKRLDPDDDGKPVQVAGMTLASRPKEYEEAHDRRIRESTFIQARKYKEAAQEAAERLGVGASNVSGGERIERNVEVLMPVRQPK